MKARALLNQAHVTKLHRDISNTSMLAQSNLNVTKCHRLHDKFVRSIIPHSQRLLSYPTYTSIILRCLLVFDLRYGQIIQFVSNEKRILVGALKPFTSHADLTDHQCHLTYLSDLEFDILFVKLLIYFKETWHLLLSAMI